MRKPYKVIKPSTMTGGVTFADPTATAGFAAPPMVMEGLMYQAGEADYMSQFGFAGSVEVTPADAEEHHAELMRQQVGDDAVKTATRAHANGSRFDFREMDTAPAPVYNEFVPEPSAVSRGVEPETTTAPPQPAPATATAGVHPVTAPGPDFKPYVTPLLFCIIAFKLAMLLVDAAARWQGDWHDRLHDAARGRARRIGWACTGACKSPHAHPVHAHRCSTQLGDQLLGRCDVCHSVALDVWCVLGVLGGDPVVAAIAF